MPYGSICDLYVDLDFTYIWMYVLVYAKHNAAEFIAQKDEIYGHFRIKYS